MMLSVGLTSFVTGITEPIEYSFLFVAPLLYAIHAVLTGVSMAVSWGLGVQDGFSFSAGLIDYVINWSLATKPWLIIPIGFCFAVVYYVLFRFAITRFNLQTPWPGARRTGGGDRERPRQVGRPTGLHPRQAKAPGPRSGGFRHVTEGVDELLRSSRHLHVPYITHTVLKLVYTTEWSRPRDTRHVSRVVAPRKESLFLAAPCLLEEFDEYRHRLGGPREEAGLRPVPGPAEGRPQPPAADRRAARRGHPAPPGPAGRARRSCTFPLDVAKVFAASRRRHPGQLFGCRCCSASAWPSASRRRPTAPPRSRRLSASWSTTR